MQNMKSMATTLQDKIMNVKHALQGAGVAGINENASGLGTSSLPALLTERSARLGTAKKPSTRLFLRLVFGCIKADFCKLELTVQTFKLSSFIPMLFQIEEYTFSDLLYSFYKIQLNFVQFP